jgi:glutamate dehydrogenase/leucine dehydrogenase
LQIQEIPESPLFVAEIKDTEIELIGWVVIHSLGLDGSCGGVRIYPDVEQVEVEQLAKAMTYKYSFYGRKMGGAKAGVKLNFNLSKLERKIRLKKFGEHIAPLLRSNIYHPWTDMNCNFDDLNQIYIGAGLKLNKLGDSAYYTALSTFSGILAAITYYNIHPKDCKITIEGLGKVGKYLAIEIDKWGGKIIGVSNRLGAIVNEDGFDIKKVIEFSEKYGDAWIRRKGNWDIISKNDLFSLSMNIHIPCARVHSINNEVAEKLCCRIIAPAANVPCTNEAEQLIIDKGVLVLPDFVLNGGGIIGTGLSELRKSDNEIRKLFFTEVKGMIIRMIELSEKNKISIIDLAKLRAHNNFMQLYKSGRENPKLSKRLYNALEWRGLIPKRIRLRRKLTDLEHVFKV